MPFILSSWTAATPGTGPGLSSILPTHLASASREGFPAVSRQAARGGQPGHTTLLGLPSAINAALLVLSRSSEGSSESHGHSKAHKPGQRHLQWASGPSFLRTHLHLPAEWGPGAGRRFSLPAFPDHERRLNQVQLAFEAVSVEGSQKCCSSSQRMLWVWLLAAGQCAP